MPRRFQSFKAETGGSTLVNDAYVGNVASTTIMTTGRTGRYDKASSSAGSFKVFGVSNLVKDSTNLLAQMDASTDVSCQSRSLYLAVIATTDLAYLNINVTAVGFA